MHTPSQTQHARPGPDDDPLFSGPPISYTQQAAPRRPPMRVPADSTDPIGHIWDVFADRDGQPAAVHPDIVTAVNQAYLARVADLTRHSTGLDPSLYTPQPVIVSPTFQPARRQSTGVPVGVWKYSVIALSTGGALWLAGEGLGAAAPGLAALQGLLAAAGTFVFSLAALVVATCIAIGAVTSGANRSAKSRGNTFHIRKAVFKKNTFRG